MINFSSPLDMGKQEALRSGLIKQIFAFEVQHKIPALFKQCDFYTLWHQ